jgi:hypothetical protein
MSGAKMKILWLIILVVIFFSFGWLNAIKPGTPCEPYGDVYFHGVLAPDGMKVEAMINNVKCAETETKNGKYRLLIPADDPVTSVKEGCSPDDSITLIVDNNRAVPVFEAFEGSQEHNVFVIASSVPKSTWGKIKALFK